MMTLSRHRGDEARDDDIGEPSQLPWDPFWELILGEDTDEEDEPSSRKGFAAPWRGRHRNNDADDDDESSFEDAGSSPQQKGSSFGARIFAGGAPGEAKTSAIEPSSTSRLGWPLSGGSSNKEQAVATSASHRRQESIIKAGSNESLDIWELDLQPFMGGSKEESERSSTSKKKSRRLLRTTKESSTASVGSSSKDGKNRRFFAFGRPRSSGQSSSAAQTSSTSAEKAKGRRSLFSRSRFLPSSSNTRSTAKRTKKLSKRTSSDHSIGTSTLELASSVGLSKGLETISNSGSKLLEWMDEELSDESSKNNNRKDRAMNKQARAVKKKEVQKKKPQATVAPLQDEKRSEVTTTTPAAEDTLSNSFQAILNWMEGSDTENSSVGTSTLDDSKGTHSTDVPTSLTSLDGANEEHLEENEGETYEDDNQFLQPSSQIFDDDSEMTTDQEPSFPDESLDTDEHTYEESLEEISNDSEQDVHIFVEEGSSAEWGSRNISSDHSSAFSPPTTTEATTRTRKPNQGILRSNPSIGIAPDVITPTPMLARQLTQSFSEQNSIIEEEDTGPKTILKSRPRQRASLSTLSRIGACLPARTLTPQQRYLSTNKGVPYHELSTRELAELFPKVRSIGDEDSSVSSSFFADQAEFDQSKPAHLQASIPRKGPQSLYEYEYESGVHMFAAYAELGSERTCPMTVNNGTVPVPSPIGRKSKEKDIIIQVEASTVSQTDCSIRAGDWWGSDTFSLPNSPGVDVVGRIYSLDPETKRRTGFMKGERVMSLVQWGGNARYLPLDAPRLVKVPEYVDPAIAVCLAETYLTAFQVLHVDKSHEERYDNLSLEDHRILIIGKAITNLGRAISELGKNLGAKVFALAKERHFEKVSSIGIRPRDVDSLDWWDELSGKIDTIVCIEEDVPTIYYKLLKNSGSVVMIRNPANGNIRIGPSKARPKKNPKRKSKRQEQPEQPDTTKVYDVFAEWKTNLDLCKADLVHLIDKLVEKQIQPQVLDRIPLSRVGQAQQLIKGRSIKGYIICEPWLVAKSRAIVL